MQRLHGLARGAARDDQAREESDMMGPYRLFDMFSDMSRDMLVCGGRAMRGAGE